jgi:hypothetical protein
MVTLGSGTRSMSSVRHGAGGPDVLIEQINLRTYPYLGAKLSPLEAWLLIRGLPTLPLRLAQHMCSVLAVPELLMGQPQVELVRHPAWSSHPGRAILTGYSRLFAFDVDASIDVPAFVDGLRMFRLGVSWGGHESLVVPALAEAPSPGGFPVFYMLDADASLTMAQTMAVLSIWRDGTGVQPTVIVGIGYPIEQAFDGKRRGFDYTPAALPGGPKQRHAHRLPYPMGQPVDHLGRARDHRRGGTLRGRPRAWPDPPPGDGRRVRAAARPLRAGLAEGGRDRSLLPRVPHG